MVANPVIFWETADVSGSMEQCLTKSRDIHNRGLGLVIVVMTRTSFLSPNECWWRVLGRRMMIQERKPSIHCAAVVDTRDG